MPDGLMNENAAGPCGHHHRHLSAFRTNRLKENGSAVDGLPHHLAYHLICDKRRFQLHLPRGITHL